MPVAQAGDPATTTPAFSPRSSWKQRAARAERPFAAVAPIATHSTAASAAAQSHDRNNKTLSYQGFFLERAEFASADQFLFAAPSAAQDALSILSTVPSGSSSAAATDGVEYLAPVAAVLVAPAAPAAVELADPAISSAVVTSSENESGTDELVAAVSQPSAAETAASAVMAAAAGPAASLPQTVEQPQDTAAARAAADSAEEAATSALAAAVAAGKISTQLLQGATAAAGQYSAAQPAAVTNFDPSAAASVTDTAITGITRTEAVAATGEEPYGEEVTENTPTSFLGTPLSPLSSLPAAVGDRLKGIIRIAAVASAVLMQLTPLPTIASLLFSASLWLLYGILLVEPTILLPNVSGVIAGASSTVLVLCITSTCVSLLLSVAAAVNVVSYAAPLAALRVVLKEKSTAMMPAEVSIGFCVGLAQLLLLAFIPPPSRQGFSTVCSSNNCRSGKGLYGAAGGMLRKTEGYFWGDRSAPLSSTAASTPSLKPSVCALSPSLPTHDELLRHCGLDNPDELFGLEADMLH
ncbi:endochitinase A [Cyclospora cayetanensis]|uniref:Endochitinase A n=1 Tax=Cyclospora cayetanensis TaxID=88456 RepID=A0A6P6S0E0_9EIME|nr:endochitinase A [Cyclospora cayetanensis]